MRLRVFACTAGLISGCLCLWAQSTHEPLRVGWERTTGEPSDGRPFQLLLSPTDPGAHYLVERSTTLEHWTPSVALQGSADGPRSSVSVTPTESRQFFRATRLIDEHHADLARARIQWNENTVGWLDYQLRIQDLGFVPPETSLAIVTVEDGIPTRVQLPNNPNDDEIFGIGFHLGLGVDGLFDRIEAALNQKPFSTAITYDADWGYPAEVRIDFDERIADEELVFRVDLLGPTPVVAQPAWIVNASSDPFRVRQASIEGNELILDLEYGGGCRTHLFALIDPMPGAFAESVPPQAHLKIYHDGRDDLCRALLFETRRFDLTPLARQFQRVYQSPGPMQVRIPKGPGTDAEAFLLAYDPVASNDLAIIRATSQGWAGGAPGSGTGIDYRFRLRRLQDRPLEFTAIWIDNRRFTPRIDPSNTPRREAQDTVVLAAAFRRVPVFDDEPEDPNQIEFRDEPPISPSAPEINGDGAALIQYRVDDTDREVVIPKITTLPFIAFP